MSRRWNSPGPWLSLHPCAGSIVWGGNMNATDVRTRSWRTWYAMRRSMASSLRFVGFRGCVFAGKWHQDLHLKKYYSEEHMKKRLETKRVKAKETCWESIPVMVTKIMFWNNLVTMGLQEVFIFRNSRETELTGVSDPFGEGGKGFLQAPVSDKWLEGGIIH